jgi:hypothetical protein
LLSTMIVVKLVTLVAINNNIEPGSKHNRTTNSKC